MSKIPYHLKHLNYIPPDTDFHFDVSKVVPSFGKFSSKEIAESFLCYKKRGLVILTDAKTNKVVQAIKWTGSDGSNKKACQKYFPQRKRSSKRRSLSRSRRGKYVRR